MKSAKTEKKDAKAYQGNIQFPIKTDPLGSYTGVPSDPKDKPIQDADDL